MYTSLVCDSGDISLPRVPENARASSFNRCFHINEKLCIYHDSVTEDFFMLWRKTRESNNFFMIFIIPVYLDIGEDYTSQNRDRV